MKPPILSSRQEWQRFFAGIAIGGIISWVLFFYMYGVMQEKQISKITKQHQQIEDLNNEIEIWKKEIQSLNQKVEKSVTIQEITITIENYKKYKIDLLSRLETQEALRKDLSSLITKDLETVYKGKNLIKKAIENKTIEINEKKYTFEVKEIMFSSTLIIEVALIRI
ncbi:MULTISPECIES: sporulation membrane protein YtrI [Bacillus]|uniref:sporulation membrane protein YtrI n=1 Tax=Bacillus TaxID=1386 RepID=UPI0003023513|nr:MULTISPECIES: sporulation membrane protein YtrI [Bacillus]